MVEVQKSPSILFAGMEGSRMPVAIAHGEGRAEFVMDPAVALEAGAVALCYVDNYGEFNHGIPGQPQWFAVWYYRIDHHGWTIYHYDAAS